MANECLVNRMSRICQHTQDFVLGQEALKNIRDDLISRTGGVQFDVEFVSAERGPGGPLEHDRFVSGMMGAAKRTSA